MTIVQSGLFKSGPYGINECLLGNMNSLYGFNSTYDIYAAFYGTNESLLGNMNSLYGFNSTYDLYAAFYGTNESLLGKKFQKMK